MTQANRNKKQKKWAYYTPQRSGSSIPPTYVPFEQPAKTGQTGFHYRSYLRVDAEQPRTDSSLSDSTAANNSSTHTTPDIAVANQKLFLHAIHILYLHMFILSPSVFQVRATRGKLGRRSPPTPSPSQDERTCSPGKNLEWINAGFRSFMRGATSRVIRKYASCQRASFKTTKTRERHA